MLGLEQSSFSGVGGVDGEVVDGVDSVDGEVVVCEMCEGEVHVSMYHSGHSLAHPGLVRLITHEWTRYGI